MFVFLLFCLVHDRMENIFNLMWQKGMTRYKFNYFLKISAFDFHWLNWKLHIPLNSSVYHYKVGTCLCNIWKFVKIFTKKTHRQELFCCVYCTACTIPQLKSSSEFSGFKHRNTKEREAFWWDCDTISFPSYLRIYLHCHKQKFSESVGFQVPGHMVSQLCIRARGEHCFCLVLEKETWVRKPNADHYSC